MFGDDRATKIVMAVLVAIVGTPALLATMIFLIDSRSMGEESAKLWTAQIYLGLPCITEAAEKIGLDEISLSEFEAIEDRCLAQAAEVDWLAARPACERAIHAHTLETRAVTGRDAMDAARTCALDDDRQAQRLAIAKGQAALPTEE